MQVNLSVSDCFLGDVTYAQGGAHKERNNRSSSESE